MTLQEREAIVAAVLTDIKKTKFNAGYDASDNEAMGVLLAEYFEWDGFEILEAASAGLEDSNFHTTAGKLDKLLDAERRRVDREVAAIARADKRARR